eukprot:TRINITY_DN13061_c0_g1_i16.p1 TRINITY_DN13061_c0_g1~~TRINITY_DN13061_c0_g1_i16.p1  ORF type:complete len:245 (+),score=-10.38 TRINITY_DN13061_c0_g1_i16:96-830(+)
MQFINTKQPASKKSLPPMLTQKIYGKKKHKKFINITQLTLLSKSQLSQSQPLHFRKHNIQQNLKFNYIIQNLTQSTFLDDIFFSISKQGSPKTGNQLNSLRKISIIIYYQIKEIVTQFIVAFNLHIQYQIYRCLVSFEILHHEDCQNFYHISTFPIFKYIFNSSFIKYIRLQQINTFAYFNSRNSLMIIYNQNSTKRLKLTYKDYQHKKRQCFDFIIFFLFFISFFVCFLFLCFAFFYVVFFCF